ncbi:MAG: YSC84-related protein [Thiobacillaceae bacterium]|nr:YSC84-related protein [Thiobacillaceae bacterium]
MFKSDVSGFPTFFSMMALLALLLPVGAAQAKSAQEIDAQVDAALADFRKGTQGADEYLASAKGVLVMPQIKKVGFVVGARWGEGALRVGGATVDYYKMEAGSLGFQAGYQEASFLFIFLTQEALDNFRHSKGWTAGVEAGITVVDEGFGGDLNTLKEKASVVAFVFGKKGLMGGYSFKGEKFTKFAPGN